MDKARYQEIDKQLRAQREALVGRIGAIRSDRRHESAPLDTNLDDQAIQHENDDALDALDDHGRRALAAIDSALARLAAGSYGNCLGCGRPIPLARLKAQPSAERCVACMDAAPTPG